jgi:hypothetical protein
MSPSSRSVASTYIATVALVVLALAGIGLVASMALRPGIPQAAATVTTGRIATQCPTDRKDTACFLSKVTNTGGVDSAFICTVSPFGETTALFADGSQSVRVQIAAGGSMDIISAVTASASGGLPAPPTVQCVRQTT